MTLGMPRAHTPVVREHPFVAWFRAHNAMFEESASGRIYRDFAGRTRIDYNRDSGEEVRFIDDVGTSTLFVIDVNSGLIEQDTYKPTDLGWVFSNVSAAYTEDRKQINGVDCIRVYFGAPRGRPETGEMGETWISKPLGIVMKDENPVQGWVWEVTAIEFREPEPGTFNVPAGLNEVQE
jgi:hypothetical protein